MGLVRNTAHMLTRPVLASASASLGQCDSCGGELQCALIGVRDPQSGHVFDIARCTSCGLGHTQPVPGDLTEYYGEPYYGQRHSFTARFCARRRVGILLREGRHRHGSLLDIGCGEGTFLRAIGKCGYARIVGTETGGAARLARESGIDVRESLEDFEPASFDAVTQWHTLEHFVSPREVVAGVARLLRDDGLYIVAVPNAHGLQAQMFGQGWFHLDVPRHLFHFGPQALIGLLERAGFRIVRWYHQELEYDVFGWLQSALNRMLRPQNVLFRSLTGKSAQSGSPHLLVHYALGTALAPLALAATALGTMLGRGGTLIAVARKTGGA